MNPLRLEQIENIYAVNIIVTATGNLSSTDVQAALEELQSDIDSLNSANYISSANLSLGTITSTQVPINIDTGTDISLLGASGTEAGLMIASDKIKLDYISVTQSVDLDAIELDVSDLITLTGVAANSTNLGTFTGNTIPDNQSIKSALQSLETAVENVSGATNLSIANRTSTTLDILSDTGTDATVPAATTSLAGLLISTDKTKLDFVTVTQSVDLDVLESDVADITTLTGVASNSTNLGTFTGTTISDNVTIKTALQEIETAIETISSYDGYSIDADNISPQSVLSGDVVKILGASGITTNVSKLTNEVTLTVDLNDTSVTPGTYGSASDYVSITIDQQGRITSASEGIISIPISQVNDVTATASELNLLDLSGLTAGWVLRATGATTAAWGQLNTSQLNNDAGFISSTTGDWTGTFDGQEGTYYLDYNNFTNTPTIPVVSDTAYGVSWNGNLDAPSKNAIYDKIETIVSFPGFTDLLTDYGFTDNSSNWNTAYGWGDHSLEGYLTANQSITLSGDVTGTGSTAITTTLSNTTVTPGSYGSAGSVATFTVDSKGRLTVAGSTAISITESQISDLGNYSVIGHTHTLSTGATDVTATQSELNILDLSAIVSPAVGWVYRVTGIGTTTAEWGQLSTSQLNNDAGFISNVVANLSLGTHNASTLDINIDTGTDITIPTATSTLAGLMSAGDKVKLDFISITQPVDLGALEQDLADITTLTGIASNSTNLGTFTGTTISDNVTIKIALQELEIAVEAAAGGGISAAYASITDGTTTSSASGSDTFKFISANNKLTVAVTSNDPTHGDNLLLTINEANIVHDNLSGFILNEHIDHSTVTLIAGEGLTGGGTISASRTLNLDISDISTAVNTLTGTDLFAVNTVGGIRKITWTDLLADIKLDSPYTYTFGGDNGTIEVLNDNDVVDFLGAGGIQTTVSKSVNTLSLIADLVIQDLAQDLTPDIASDFIITYNISENQNNKVLISDLGFLTTNQSITLSGDVTGTGSTAITTTLSNTTVTPGSYGSAGSVATFTVDSKGRLTAAGSTAILITESQISDLGSYSVVGHTHTTSDITDLSSYTGFDVRYYTEAEVDSLLTGYSLTGHNHTLDSLSNVTITSIATGEIIKWNGSAWINNTLAEAGISAIGHTHTTSDITDLSSYTGFDSRYYTETEVDSLLTGYSITGHAHTLSSGATDVTATASELNLLDLSALTAGWVLRATGATTAAWGQLKTSELNNDAGFLSSVTGDWTGTFDGQEGTYYLDYNNFTNTPTIPVISDAAYGVSWNGNLDAPSKNAIYDKIETIVSFPGFTDLLTDYGFTDNSSNWNTAYSWGDHSLEGYLTANQSITLSGDVTGTGSTAISTTLSNTTVTPGSYGSAGSVATFTVDSKGRLTAAGSTAISITESQISDLGSYSVVGHTHTTADITNLASYTGFDARYYTETEVDSLLTGYSLTSHNHTLDSLSNVTITSIATGEIIKWNGSAWINNTLAEAGVSAVGHTHTTSDITNLSSYTGFDARYYTETEVNSLLTGYSLTSHTHTLSTGATDVTASASEVNLLDLSGLTAGWVLRATGAATAAWGQLNTSQLNNDAGFISSTTGDWTGTFDGQEGTYYLDYNNFTNTPTIPVVSDTAYGVSWNGNLDAPSKNAIYDKIETIVSFPGFTDLLTDYGFTDNSSNWNTAYGWGDHSVENYLKNIVEDTTPQLGGTLDTNGQKIRVQNASVGGDQIEFYDGAVPKAYMYYASGQTSFNITALSDLFKINAFAGLSITAGAQTFTWPTAQGGTNYYLKNSNGSGTLTFSQIAASEVSNTASGNLTATTVQAALNELQGDIDTINSGLVTSLNDLSDVAITNAFTNQFLRYNGTNWVNTFDIINVGGTYKQYFVNGGSVKFDAGISDWTPGVVRNLYAGAPVSGTLIATISNSNRFEILTEPASNVTVTLGGGTDGYYKKIAVYDRDGWTNTYTLDNDTGYTLFDLVAGTTVGSFPITQNGIYEITYKASSLTWYINYTTFDVASHNHTLSDITDVTATSSELNLLDLSGLTTGWVLKATGAATAAWGQLAATNVSYSNATSGLAATTVQAAVDEIEGRVDTLESSNRSTVQIPVIAYDSDVSTGDGKAYFVIDSVIAGKNLVACNAQVVQTGTGSNPLLIQVYNVTQTTDMLTTRINIDATERSSHTAAIPYVIDTANDDVAQYDLLRIDIDQLHGTTAPKGLILVLEFE